MPFVLAGLEVPAMAWWATRPDWSLVLVDKSGWNLPAGHGPEHRNSEKSGRWAVTLNVIVGRRRHDCEGEQKADFCDKCS